MIMNVLVISAVLVAVTDAVPGMGMGMGMFPPMGRMPMGGGHGPHEHEERPGKILTCQMNFRDVQRPGWILNSITINIKERPEERSDGGYGHAGFGMGMAPMRMNLMHQGNDKPGLEASIGLMSTTGGKVTIAITETARPQAGCAAESFGRFLKSAGAHEHTSPMGGMGMKYGMGGMGMKYGMGGMGMKYGMGMMPGFGSTSVKSQTHTPFGSFGVKKHSSGFGMGGGMGGYGLSPMMMGMGMRSPMGMMGMGMAGHDHDHADEPAGAIATTDISPNIRASIVIDRLKGFETLDELAGRGVVVCPAQNVDHDFDDNSMCSGGILSCCALHYDSSEVSLSDDVVKANYAPGYNAAPANQGYASAADGGYAAPANQGYGASADGGYAAPANQGYGASADGGYAAPADGGYAAPADGGYAAPANQGYSAPTADQGYNAPAAQGYAPTADQGYPAAPNQGYNAPANQGPNYHG